MGLGKKIEKFKSQENEPRLINTELVERDDRKEQKLSWQVSPTDLGCKSKEIKNKCVNDILPIQ
jgi:hypothetical protein